MTAKAKVVNYTPAMVERMVEAYTAVGTGVTKADHEARAVVVAQLAVELKKEPRSIRSKLVSQKVYIKVAPESKVTGETPEKKEVLAERLVSASGLNVSATSIAKMNKLDIQAFLNHFNAEIVEMEDVPDENDSQEGETDSES